jgi:hypothetical protein
MFACDETKANSWWENLPYGDKLKAFYVVTKKIHEDDILSAAKKLAPKGAYDFTCNDVY